MKILHKNITKTKVMDWNAAYYGVSIYDWMDRAGRGIARILSTSPSIPLLARRGKPMRIAFFCGLGNNGGDGFAAAKYLHDSHLISPSRGGEKNGGHEVMVYLFGKEKDIKTDEARRTWEEMKMQKVPYQVIASPLEADEACLPHRQAIPIQKRLLRSKAPRSDDYGVDIAVDCLLGTGVKGELREPIASAVKLFNKLSSRSSTRPSTGSGKKERPLSVAVDFPTQGIKNIDLVISMQFPKVEGAEVVDLQSPSPYPSHQGRGNRGRQEAHQGREKEEGRQGRKGDFISKIGIGEFKALEFPGPDSHKGDGGRLLIIAGNEQYHGAFLYSIKTASKIVDLIYFLSSEMNQELARALRSKTAEYIPVGNPPQPPLNLRGEEKGDDTLNLRGEIKGGYDCVMIGPGMGKEKLVMNLAIKALKTKKKIVLDADVLEPDILEYLHNKAILTPHKAEFKRTFAVEPDEKNILKMAKKHDCTIVLKGKVDIVANPDWGLKYNYTGNVGMTKGGTGDVLAALTAAFYCLTDDPYVAASSGVFVNGLAGDELYERVSRFYNAEDLIEQIPKTLKRLVKS